MADNVTVVPWGLHPLSKWVTKELKRRANEYGQTPSPSQTSQYSGPRTAWARVFSNGKSKYASAENKDGFVLGGTFGFNESFGFTSTNEITIGVDAKGNPHKIVDGSVAGTSGNRTKPDFPHRPPPSLESINCELSGANSGFPNLCRKITINWKCYSLAQLNYMVPYFLTPRITCLVEWGWNNYDTVSLVDLTDTEWMNNMFTDPSYTTEYLEKSNGNYDAGIGFIVDYGYKMNENGGYDCHTTILNANKLIEGEQIATKEVTIKQDQEYISAKSFYSFAKEDLASIDTDDEKYVNMRTELQIGKKEIDEEGNVSIIDNIEDRVFRIKSSPIGDNKPGFWLRMDVIQDIINAFFKIKMEGSNPSMIREFDISETIICASPLLKSSNKNVLVPNRYAPRFVYFENGSSNGVIKDNKPEDAEYTNLFKDKIEDVLKEYYLDNTTFDNLQEAINPKGESFPAYRNISIKDNKGNPVQTLKSGQWGYLKDLYIEVEYFKKLITSNDSVLKMIEQLLQGINEALCQICQLKLQPAQYGNSKYSVYDENMAGASSKNDASFLPVITLGALDSAFIRAASFDVKMSSEMMNQLVMQSANPQQDKNGSTQTKIVAANPIVSRYSSGDRLYEKGILETVVAAAKTPSVKDIDAHVAQQDADIKKKRQARSNKNKNTFYIYYKQNPNDKKNHLQYFICENNSTFLNYILKLPNKEAPYLNNAIMPGTTLTLEFLGISGIDYLSQFLIDHAPDPYSKENAVWQVADIKQTVEDKMWTTTIVAQVRPLTTL
jgi:hypothetical protein